MIPWKRRTRQILILACFVSWLGIGVSGYTAPRDVLKGPFSEILTSALVVTAAAYVLFYGLAYRPKRWRWAARIVPLLFILACAWDQAYVVDLPDNQPSDVPELAGYVIFFVTSWILLYFTFRYGYSPKLPPDAFSPRVLFVALLGAGSVSFISYVPGFTTRIRVTHDYLRELNELARPVPYDANENAALDYARLVARIGTIPEDVNRVMDLWPSDMDDAGQRAVRAWVLSDPGAVDELIVAGRKPHYWIERHEPKGDLMGVELPENHGLRTLVSYLLLHAKLDTCDGNIEAAAEKILAGYAMGSQLAGPKTTLEQLMGMALCNVSMTSAFEVLSKVHLESTLLARFQDRLRDLSTRWNHGFDCRPDRLMVLDWIQRAFSDDGAGGGCISGRRSYGLGWGWVRIDRTDTVSLLEELIASLDVETRITPWQSRAQGQDTLKILERRNNPALWRFMSDMPEFVTLSWRLRTRTAALLATLAIFRYRADTGHLPTSLYDLASGGYLDAVPLDPFGDGPLVYRQQDGDFVLYSRGLDFDDDGGVPSRWGKGDQGGDQVFWPANSPGGTNR